MSVRDLVIQWGADANVLDGYDQQLAAIAREHADQLRTAIANEELAGIRSRRVTRSHHPHYPQIIARIG